MSYDLHLLRLAQGEDPRAVLRQYLNRQHSELNPGPMDPGKEEEKLRLARGLVRLNPSLSLATFDFESVARIESITEAEARSKYRHLELNGDDYSGIQITLWDDSVDITFPHWHSGEQARDVFSQVWDYLGVLEQWGGFVTYDSQLGRVIDLKIDFDAAFARYMRGENTEHLSAERKRPRSRWKFW